MKKFLLLIIVLSQFSSGLDARQYPVNWATSRHMNPGSDVTRSLAYNRATDHVLVATRKYGVDVILLNAANGDSVGKLDTGIITGGTYSINMVATADDGTIYVSNLSAPQYTPGSTLKVYRYANESAAPELVFDNALDGARYGDSFAAVGSGTSKYIYCSGMGNSNIVVLKDIGTASLVLDKYLPLPQPGAARHGISPVTPGGNVWINGADTGTPPPQLISNNGTVIAVVPDSIASAGGTSCVLHMILGNYNLVTVTNAWSLSIRSARFFEDELGTVTFNYFGTNSDSLPLLYNGSTFINNANATTSLDYDSKRHAVLTLFGFNSIASVSLDSLVKASTPRPDSLTVSVDGKNDFFPTDHVGTSNGRDMYLTWSEGKLFVGITGSTLIDPTSKNRLYLAFNLDPQGTNGSNTPPEDAGGVKALPFMADVVYMVEPWNEADYLIGNIYKWDGSAWKSSEFDGNLASQGALAFADEGDRKLAEVSAIMNAPGIGMNFTSIAIMAYVAETGSAGNVLCAFPDVNPIGNAAAFGHYFYIESLGSGMFPTDTDQVKIMGQPSAIDGPDGLPAQVKDYRLYPNYPNPFNPETVIRYSLSRPGLVTIEVYDINGRLIRNLVNERRSAGNHEVTFSAKNLSTGIYFYQLRVSQVPVAIRKMTLIK